MAGQWQHRRLIAAAIYAVMACALLLLPTSAAYGDTLDTGNDLLALCQDNHNFYKQGVCSGFIHGSTRAFVEESNAENVASPFCIPAGVTVGQVVDVVIKSLKEHPESRHSSATSLIRSALISTFPCAQK